ncbi:HNH endonuclease [Halomonas getboli]|uniref:HNH endonuclease n=1 Tax=Halomonas getboli TaxID=2935862 RepID=UPI001FFE9C30|nr:HNH endonuclease [Halomonas getboli]MCK2185520.1 HNH endonuclease [Halomonas getboli]
MDERLECLKRLRTGSPFHKPGLMMAIICEIQAGHITSSRVDLDDRLLARYHDIYEALKGERSNASPWLPLWHLASDKGPSGPLWTPDYLPEIAPLAKQLGQPKSLNQLFERFSSARLDAELFEALQAPGMAEAACQLIAHHHLASEPDALGRLQKYLRVALASGEYERQPDRMLGSVEEASQQQYARSAAFRSLVLEAYDYRCAATRLRYITPDYRYLVEAAHLIPFSVSQDDRPVNGLALTPNLHWAMDNHLIAPGPDKRWHVSPVIDALVPDNRWLCELDNAPLSLPRDEQRHPSPEALAWRLAHLQH